MRCVTSSCLALLVIEVTFSAANGATLYVDINGPAPSGPWASAYQNLQTAIDAASGEDEIWVADGTYIAPTNGFDINEAVRVYGGFAGNETQLSQRDFVRSLAVLSGDAGMSGNLSDNRSVVIRVTTTSSLARLDGFTIRDAWGTNAQGGAVFPSAGIVIGVGSSPTIQNCRIIANRGHPMDGAGGGLFFDGRSAALILDTLFEDNSAGEGGAIYLDHSNQEIDTPTIERCRFIRNVAGRAGGAIANYYDYRPIVRSCIFAENQSLSIFGAESETGGGAIHTSLSSLQVTNCLFTDNFSLGHGGAIFHYAISPDSLQVTNSTFFANHSPYNDGGAISIRQSSAAIIKNTVLWANDDSDGSGQFAQIRYVNAIPTIRASEAA